MIEASNISISFNANKLFDHVNIKFTDGNCYGIIGANGSGKSTFLKALAGEIETTDGTVIMPEGHRLTMLKQDHFEFDENNVLDTVFVGHKELYSIIKEREELYAKEDLTDEEGMRVAELECDFADLNGWESEAEAAALLSGLGIKNELLEKKMKELMANDKVKVLLAQALFGNPDVLLLDEPTNHLDIEAISWLENFLLDYKKTVLVVSHDRHFLNKVCSHIADIDFKKIKLYVGNYAFWRETSEMALKMLQDSNKKMEDKANDLRAFIQRFSANASKSKQATSRKKLLEKITLEDIQPSSRKYPFINFTPSRDVGNDILSVTGLSKTVNGEKLLNNISFTVSPGEKIAFVGPNDLAKTTLFDILMGKITPDEGEFKFGSTISLSYLPKDNTEFFNDNDDNLQDWLGRFSEKKEADFIRGFLGRMLFSGDNVLKEVKVLSGGEKMRLMYSKLMLTPANFLIIDGPTEHLDLESISSVNKGLTDYQSNIFLSTHDHRLIQTVANRIMQIVPSGIIDDVCTYNEWLSNARIKEKLKAEL